MGLGQCISNTVLLDLLQLCETDEILFNVGPLKNVVCAEDYKVNLCISGWRAAKQWVPIHLIISNLCVAADEKLLKHNHLDPLSDTENEVSDFNDETGCKVTLRWESTASHF